MRDEPIGPDATASHDERIGVAYVAALLPLARLLRPRQAVIRTTTIRRSGSHTKSGGATKWRDEGAQGMTLLLIAERCRNLATGEFTGTCRKTS